MQVSSGGPVDDRQAPRPGPQRRSRTLFDADRDQIRRDPLEAAHLLRGLTIAGTHPALDPRRAAAVRRRSSRSSSTASAPTRPEVIRVNAAPTPAHVPRPLPEAAARRRRADASSRSMCTLILPTLNADIIDKGVLTGDTDYIWRIGGVMLLITFVQVAFAICGGLLRRPRRDGVRPRRARRAVPPGHRLLGPGRRRARRAVADHPHHQRRDAGADPRPDVLHAARRRADHDRRRRDLRGARGRSALAAAAREHPGARDLRRARDHPDGPAVPGHAGAHRPDQRGPARADHRNPGRAGVRAGARRGEALRRRPTTTSR